MTLKTKVSERVEKFLHLTFLRLETQVSIIFSIGGDSEGEDDKNVETSSLPKFVSTFNNMEEYVLNFINPNSDYKRADLSDIENLPVEKESLLYTLEYFDTVNKILKKVIERTQDLISTLEYGGVEKDDYEEEKGKSMDAETTLIHSIESKFKAFNITCYKLEEKLVKLQNLLKDTLATFDNLEVFYEEEPKPAVIPSLASLNQKANRREQ